MSNTEHTEGTRSSLPLAALVATASAVLALALAGGHAAQGHSGEHADAAASGVSEQRVALQDKMRRLWEDHITWTRLFIVSAGPPTCPTRRPRHGGCCENQEDIGDAIKPFYGRAPAAADGLCYREHITVAAALLAVRKGGRSEPGSSATAARGIATRTKSRAS